MSRHVTEQKQRVFIDNSQKSHVLWMTMRYMIGTAALAPISGKIYTDEVVERVADAEAVFGCLLKLIHVMMQAHLLMCSSVPDTIFDDGFTCGSNVEQRGNTPSPLQGVRTPLNGNGDEEMIASVDEVQLLLPLLATHACTQRACWC